VTARQPRKIRRGSRFGKWKVIETGLRTGNRGDLAALCACECGQVVKMVRYDALRGGASQSCHRCSHRVKGQIRKGQRFGKRKVLQTGLRDNRGRLSALCECSCGDVRLVQYGSLLDGKAMGCQRCASRFVPPARLNPEPGWHQPDGRLRVLTGKIVRDHNGDRAVWCRCDCGTKLIIRVPYLFNGNRKSCGCLNRERIREIGAQNVPALAAWSRSEANLARITELARSEANRARGRERLTTHGLSRHPLYDTWVNMIDRCENTECRAFPYYGGRGIKVCKRWHDVRNFIADIEDTIGPRPEGRHPGGAPLYTLDRIDNERGNYEPGKVRWATAAEQRANQRDRAGSLHEALTGVPDSGWECGTCGQDFPSLPAFDKHRRREHPRAS